MPDRVYTVHLMREGESGADMFLLGIYADEFTARRVARETKPVDDEWVDVTSYPVLTAPIEQGDPNAPEPWGVWTRHANA